MSKWTTKEITRAAGWGMLSAAGGLALSIYLTSGTERSSADIDSCISAAHLGKTAVRTTHLPDICQGLAFSIDEESLTDGPTVYEFAPVSQFRADSLDMIGHQGQNRLPIRVIMTAFGGLVPGMIMQARREDAEERAIASAKAQIVAGAENLLKRSL